MSRSTVDLFYKQNGPCCAGCDWWRYYNAVLGECTKNAPVSGVERWSMLEIEFCSMHADAGHIVTPRHHVCGGFIDSDEKTCDS